MSEMDISLDEGMLDEFPRHSLQTMYAGDILNLDIEDMELSRVTTRFFLKENVYKVKDYIDRQEEFRAGHQMLDSLLEDEDFHKQELKNWARLNADIEIMTKLFEVGFWRKIKEECDTKFPMDSYALLFVPIKMLGINLEYVSILKRAGYMKLADLLDEESGNVSADLIDEAVSSLLHRLVRQGYISKECANLIKDKRNSIMNPDKRKCNEYRQAIANIAIANNLEYNNFKCFEKECCGHCDANDENIKAMLHGIRNKELAGQNMTIRNISLDNLIHFFSDIKRLEER